MGILDWHRNNPSIGEESISDRSASEDGIREFGFDTLLEQSLTAHSPRVRQWHRAAIETPDRSRLSDLPNF